MKLLAAALALCSGLSLLPMIGSAAVVNPCNINDTAVVAAAQSSSPTPIKNLCQAIYSNAYAGCLGTSGQNSMTCPNSLVVLNTANLRFINGGLECAGDSDPQGCAQELYYFSNDTTDPRPSVVGGASMYPQSCATVVTTAAVSRTSQLNAVLPNPLVDPSGLYTCAAS